MEQNLDKYYIETKPYRKVTIILFTIQDMKNSYVPTNFNYQDSSVV
jgi:hypothetical protein